MFRRLRVYIVLLPLLLLTFLIVDNWFTGGDTLFLYNRMEQMYLCLCDGNMPWFYYNDFGGLGYGSSFFYGQLTLVPFLIFVPLGYIPCMFIFMCCSFTCVIWGSRLFLSRYVVQVDLLTFAFILSPVFLSLIYLNRLYLLISCFGLLLAFFAYCVDFFRDKKSFLPALLMFFILINTNKTETVVGAVGVIIIFLYYLDITRWKEYIKFASLTVVSCSYTLLNVIYHSDVLTRVDEIAACHLSGDSYIGRLNSKVFGTRLLYGLLGDGSEMSPLLSITVLVVIVLSLKHMEWTKKKIMLVILFVVAVVLSTKDVWIYVNSIYDLGLQFPLRYTPLLVVLLFCLFLSRTLGKHMKSAIVCISLFTLFTLPLTISYDDNIQSEIGNKILLGEFLDESFDCTVAGTCYLDYTDLLHNVTDLSDMSILEFNEVEGVITLTLDGTEGVIRFPKLYYKGYQCYSSDISFDAIMGYSQYIEVDFNGYAGDITLEYQHPIWLQVLFWVNMFIISYIIYKIVLTKRDKYSIIEERLFSDKLTDRGSGDDKEEN